MLNRKAQKVQSIQHDSVAFPVLFVNLITGHFFFHLCSVNKLMQRKINKKIYIGSQTAGAEPRSKYTWSRSTSSSTATFREHYYHRRIPEIPNNTANLSPLTWPSFQLDLSVPSHHKSLYKNHLFSILRQNILGHRHVNTSPQTPPPLQIT
jgi:hypothetical protein